MLNKLLNKITIMFAIFFLIGSAVFYVLLHDFHEEEVGQLIQERLVLSESTQKYVSQYQKPAIDKLIKEGKLTEDFFDPALMSSTFVVAHVNDISEQGHEDNNLHSHEEIIFKFVSDNPTNPLNKADAFESEILKKFNNSDISTYKQMIKYKGKDTLMHAFAARKNTKSCLKCHGDPKDAPKQMLEIYGDKNGFNEKVGDVRAINVIYSTIDADKGMLKVFLTIEVLMLIIFLIIYFTVRHFLIQLNEKDKFIVKQSKFAAMGEMIGMIAHQWRQPLTGMGITTNNLLLDVELQDIDEKRLKGSLEVVNKQIEYLSNTIDDFQNFFRPENKPEIVNISKVVKEACAIIDSSIKRHRIDIKLDIGDEVTISTMKNDVIQIILNLIRNSMDAYKENKIEDKVVEISAVDKPERVEILVKDNAGGIPKDVLEKIFDPYFSTKDKNIGTGLGLYMSKMIIESHLGGQLEVETADKSTIFSIIIPKEKEK